MKTQIKIHGQIGGNFNLLRKMHNYSDMKKGMFNSFYLTYDSKSEAQKDLSQCFISLKEESPETYGLDLYRTKGGRAYKITYDASKAEIIENN